MGGGSQRPGCLGVLSSLREGSEDVGTRGELSTLSPRRRDKRYWGEREAPRNGLFRNRDGVEGCGWFWEEGLETGGRGM